MTNTSRDSFTKYIVPSVMIAAGIFIAIFFLRGTLTKEIVMPESASNEPSCTVVQEDNGSKPVRCAMAVAAEASKVWSAITSYNQYGEIFENSLWSITSQASDETAQGSSLKGTVDSVIGTFDFHSAIRYGAEGDTKTASWDQAGGALSVNRGNWEIIPKGPTETLVLYTLEISVPPYPSFLVRNCLLTGLPMMMSSLKTYLSRQ